MTAQPMPPSEEAKQPLLSARQIGVAAAFGGAALAIVLAGLTLPIPGTPSSPTRANPSPPSAPA